MIDPEVEEEKKGEKEGEKIVDVGGAMGASAGEGRGGCGEFLLKIDAVNKNIALSLALIKNEHIITINYKIFVKFSNFFNFGFGLPVEFRLSMKFCSQSPG